MTEITDLKIENKKGYLWISFPNSIGRENILPIQNRIEAILTDESAHVALDFSNIDIAGSIVIDLVMLIRKILSESKGFLCLVNVSKTCLKQFHTMNLDKVVTIYESENEIKAENNEINNS